MPEPTITITLRLRADGTFEKLKALAEREGHSLNAFLVLLLREACENR